MNTKHVLLAGITIVALAFGSVGIAAAQADTPPPAWTTWLSAITWAQRVGGRKEIPSTPLAWRGWKLIASSPWPAN